MTVDYNHGPNDQTLAGPKTVIPVLFADSKPASLLDVGCGIGTWLKAAADFGIADSIGVDGVDIPSDRLLFPSSCFRLQDLTETWDLGRRFDVALCLEVAEHLDEAHAATLIDALARHSDTIVFSAACPNQPGWHHVNCQWPDYWQQLFNQCGYSCEDTLRWKIWNMEGIDPWYKQNIFIARRDSRKLEQEAIIPAVVHPEMMGYVQRSFKEKLLVEYDDRIVHGEKSLGWYLALPMQAIWAKVRRKLKQERKNP